MSGTHHRTWQQYHVGHLNVTIQLDSTTENRNLERHQELADVARQLIATMDAGRLAATWAVSDPVHSAATSLLLKSAVTHELAILGDTTWVGPTAGRTRFARELARRISKSRAAGLQVTTLVPSVASIDDNIDLVVKQGITAVVRMQHTVTATLAEPRALHYGVWDLPISACLPLEIDWFGSNKRAVWRSIRRAASDAGTFHLLIDAAAIAASGRRERATVKWLVDRLATLRDRGLIRVETLRRTANRLSSVPTASPQRSILRVA